MKSMPLESASGKTGPYFAISLATLIKRHRTWVFCAAVSAILASTFLALSVFDERLLIGVSVWSKPFKFSLSFCFYFLTLAWFAPLLRADYFTTWRAKVLTWLPIVCALFEIGYIALQAGLGETSHFNSSSALHSTMYKLMGVAAVMLVTVCLWMAAAIVRHRGVSDPYVLAVVIGLSLTFLLGGVLGGYLSSQSSHWVNATASDANGLWLFHWSRDGGDLRIAHFFGIHAMQVLPLMAWPLAGKSHWSARLIVVVMAGVYIAFTLGTFSQAVAGRSFIG